MEEGEGSSKARYCLFSVFLGFDSGYWLGISFMIVL